MTGVNIFLSTDYTPDVSRRALFSTVLSYTKTHMSFLSIVYFQDHQLP